MNSPLENAPNCFLYNEVKLHLLKDAQKSYPRIITPLSELFWSTELCNLTTIVSGKLTKNPHFPAKICNFTINLTKTQRACFNESRPNLISGWMWWISVSKPLTLAVKLHNFTAFQCMYEICGGEKQLMYNDYNYNNKWKEPFYLLCIGRKFKS